MCQIVITSEEAKRTPFRVGTTETGLFFVTSAAMIPSGQIENALKSPLLLREGELNYRREYEQCENFYNANELVFDDYFVLTSSRYSRGTTYLLDNDILNHCRELFGQDYYILPEGVDALLLCPRTEDPEQLVKALRAANAARPEIAVSDSVFLFNGQLTRV